MNSFKLNNFQKFACFVLIIILVICTVGFAADGWQLNLDIFNNDDNTPEANDGNNNQTDDPDEDNNASNPPPELDTPTAPPEPQEPVFFSLSTGLQVSKEEFERAPIGIILDPSSPLYGISSSDISIEFPIEDGSTRLLAYTTSDEVMWKIGTLKPTRNYISSLSNLLGGVIVSYGKDDIISYDVTSGETIELDLSKYSDCYYVENSNFIYTSEAMIETAINRLASGTKINGYKNMPYKFIESESTLGYNVATAITIPYSSTNETRLYYNELSGQYLYYKSENRKMDMLTGKNISYTNVFVLFSNATTYENSSGSQMIIDTTSGGKGYYISQGKLSEFNWSVNENGELEFKNLMGEPLAVNRGNSYISFYKASNSSKITFS